MSDLIPDTESRKQTQRVLSRVFRRFTGVLADMEDLQAFSGGLQSLLREFPELEQACIQNFDTEVAGAAGREDFRRRQLVLPMPGRRGLQGAMAVPDNRRGRRLGAEDLHLLSALAGLFGTLLDRGRAYGEARRRHDLLNHLLDLMPLGVICADARGEIVQLNRPAREFLRVGADGESPHLTLALEGTRGGRGAYHLKVGDALYYAHGSSYPADAETPAAYITLLYDLTRERDRVLEFLLREAYRCQWKDEPMTALCIQAPTAESRLMARIPELESALDTRGLIGPVDAQTLVAVLPGRSGIAARNWIRRNAGCLPPLELQLGLAELDPGRDDGPALLERALADLRERHAFLRHRLLLVDPYAPVSDALALLLRPRFELEKVTNAEAAIRRLEARPFDGMLMDRHLHEDPRRVDSLIAALLERNPEGAVVLMSEDEPAGGSRGAPPGDRRLHRLQKPFDTAEVEALVREAWPQAFGGGDS